MVMLYPLQHPSILSASTPPPLLHHSHPPTPASHTHTHTHTHNSTGLLVLIHYVLMVISLLTSSADACQLTLDANTAHRELSLSQGGRKVTRSGDKVRPYPDHPERFDSYHQVLCREGLTGRCYWEVEWREVDGNKRKGWTAVGVAYKQISRKGFTDGSFLGGSKNSWSLEVDHCRYFSQHNRICSPVVEFSCSSRRVGVYLDWPAGTLSFYRISSDTPTRMHTFSTTFTEPVYPGFGVLLGFSVSLCMLG